MKIKVQQQGGFMGLDREIKVDGSSVTVVDNGTTWGTRSLREVQRQHLDALAARVAGLDHPVTPKTGALPSDAMATSIAIEDGERTKSLQVTSGDDAADEVWELIGFVNAIPSSD